jgi:ADP-heptose:LPS heptosyltransferase
MAVSLYEHRHLMTLLGEALGVEVTDPRPALYLTREEDEAGARRMAAFHTPVVIHAASRNLPNKNWDPECWAALVRSRPGMSFVQVGEPREPRIAGAVSLFGLPLRDALAAVKHARAVVAVDSMFAHAAAAFDVPAVVLWGPTHPSLIAHPRHVRVSARTPCSPCIDILGAEPCPYDKACLTAITPAQVARALDSIVLPERAVDVRRDETS